MKEQVIQWLRQRGVEVNDIARIVLDLQQPYDKTLTMEDCRESVLAVLGKREAQWAILTGIAIDVTAEQGHLPEPLRTAIRSDEPLYGVDEILALSITNVYGSVGLTTFGYLDKRKPGIIGRLNSHRNGEVHTFLDDLVSGIAAAASARLAHQREKREAGYEALAQPESA